MSGLLQDLGFFLRTVRRAPGFFTIAVLTLALGIGANTAIFSVINAVLIRPLPFHEPDRLVRLFETEAAPGRYPFAGPDYLDWQSQNQTLEGMSLFAWERRANISGGSHPESAGVSRVEANFFSVLGVNPLMGRTLRREDGAAGGGEVAVISYGFWQRHFGGDPGIVNKWVELDARRHLVVGVMPSWFNYPRDIDVWTPLDMSPQGLGQRGSHSFMAIGRLKPGVSVERAQSDLAVIAGRLEKQYPDTNDKVGAAVVSMKEQLTARSREPLLILLGAVALVLLVACANVANLLLVRAGVRRRELAIRSALGAGRMRVIRQMLTESVLLSLTGGAAGLSAAWWGVRLLQSVKSLPIPLVNPIGIDSSVLAFTLGAAVLTGLLFGTLPALQASGSSLGEELKSGSRSVLGAGRGARRLRDGIAVAEIAVSLALLVGAGLLLRSYDKMRRAETGVDFRQVLTMGISLPQGRYNELQAERAFYDRLLERLGSVPGVRAISASTQIPLEGGSNGYITVPGQDDSRLRNQLFEWNYITRDYFRTFGIPVIQGRGFAAEDESHAAAVAVTLNEVFSSPSPQIDRLRGMSWPAVVNRTMARLVWPNQDPIGRTFTLGGALTIQVIGVAADANVSGIRDGVAPQAYLPFVGALGGGGFKHLVVKAEGTPLAVLSSVRAQLGVIDPTLAVFDPRTMDDILADGMADTTLQTWLLGVFAAVAVMLAAIGLYSVMASLVAQRRHEIGIRTALGAGRADLLRLVMGHAAVLTVLGVGAGLTSAFFLTRVMQGLLYGVEARDATTFAAVSGLVVLVALAASAAPARRATRVDPIIALRYE